MRKLLYAAVLAAALLLPACTDPEGAQRAAKAYGLKGVQITGHRFIGCGKDDTTSTGFTAFDRDGNPVSGVVCGDVGLFGKSNTVRID